MIYWCYEKRKRSSERIEFFKRFQAFSKNSSSDCVRAVAGPCRDHAEWGVKLVAICIRCLFCWVARPQHLQCGFYGKFQPPQTSALLSWTFLMFLLLIVLATLALAVRSYMAGIRLY